MIVMSTTYELIEKRKQYEAYLRVKQHGGDEYDLKLAREILGLTLEDIEGFETEAEERALTQRYAEASGNEGAHQGD